MIKILNIREMGKWQIRGDGWFEWYECSECGHKLGLTCDVKRKDLPDKCPNCNIPINK